MKKILSTAVALLVVQAVFVPLAAAARPARLAVSKSGPDRIAGEVIVRYRSGVDAPARAAIRDAVGSLAARSVIPRSELVELAPGTTVTEAIDALESDPNVAYAEPNYEITAAATPNDPSFSNLWAMYQSSDADIDATDAWNKTTGSEDVIVGIMDSGIDRFHADLADNIWTNPGESGSRATNGVDDDNNGKIDDVHGWDFADLDNDAMDDLGHGTHVAGTIGAQGDNGAGVTGVNWNVSLMPLRVLGSDGVGSTWDAAQAFTYAANQGVKVVNASLGGAGFSRSLNDAIAAAPGTLLVTSAGNKGTNNDEAPQYPCNMAPSNIICVAATNWSDGLASYSNYGAASVDIGAPGSYILSTTPGGSYAYYSGTSMAAPHVAGAAGLLLSDAPDATAAELKTALMDGAVSIPSLATATVTGGRLNVNRSLDLIAPVPEVPAATPTPVTEPVTPPSAPAPSQPAPSQPAPSQPAPSQPAPSAPVTEPTPVADPTPTPTTPAEPSPAAPEPTPTTPSPSVFTRSVVLRVRPNRIIGRVSMNGDYEPACVVGVPVRIKRNGVTIATVRTGADGRFSQQLTTRTGRYSAVARRVETDGDVCSAATSSIRSFRRR